MVVMFSMFDTKSKDLQGDQFYSKISFFTTSVYYDFFTNLLLAQYALSGIGQTTRNTLFLQFAQLLS